jgi:hypothetical protein
MIRDGIGGVRKRPAGPESWIVHFLERNSARLGDTFLGYPKAQ